MILNTGNRTDIPAYYGKWFANRLKEGYVFSRNPYNPQLIKKYILDPKVVDVIAFCSKNPLPFLQYMPLLKEYRVYFQVTITPYDPRIEPHVPNKNRVIDGVKALSGMIGSSAIAWRYDPILIDDYYTVDYHIHIFEEMCKRLSGYVDVVIISFIDLYRKTRKNFPHIREVTLEEQHLLAVAFKEIAQEYGLHLKTCLEDSQDLRHLGIDVNGCMTKETLEKAFHITLNVPHLNQAREGCSCLLNNDIGFYNSCPHGCLYCYANEDQDEVMRNIKRHDPNSPLLIGHVHEDDIIKEAKQESYIEPQLSIFDF